MTQSLVPCPVCARAVSTAATSCPQCGHPLTPEQSPEALEQAEFDSTLKRIRRRAFVVITVLALPTLSVPTLIAKLTSPNLAGASEFEKLWQAFALTAPLSVAVAAISVAILRAGWRGIEELLDGGIFTLISVLLGVCVVLAAPAFLIGNFLPNPPVNIVHTATLVWQMDGEGISQWVVKPAYFIYWVVSQYWRAYGPWPFTSAIIVGIFLGWSIFQLAQHKQALKQRVLKIVKEY